MAQKSKSNEENREMKLQPIGRSLLIQAKKKEKKKGVLILTDDSSEPLVACVIGVGEKVEAPIKVNDLVLVAPYCGSKIQGGTEEEPYLLIGEKEVLGILKDEQVVS